MTLTCVLRMHCLLSILAPTSFSSDGEPIARGATDCPSVAPHSSMEIVLDGISSSVASTMATDARAELTLTVWYQLLVSDPFRDVNFNVGLWYGDASGVPTRGAARTLPGATAPPAKEPAAKAAATAVTAAVQSVLSPCLPCLANAERPADASQSAVAAAITRPPAPVAGVRRRAPPPLTVVDNGTTITVTGGGQEGIPAFTYVLTRASGKFTSATYDGQTLFLNGPVPNVYRAPTDNDKGGAAASYDARWRKMGLHTTSLQSIVVSYSQEGTGPVTLAVDGALPTLQPVGQISYTVRATVQVEGTVAFSVAYEVQPSNPDAEVPPLCRFGVTFEVPITVQSVTWFGRGPHEKYARGTALVSAVHLGGTVFDAGGAARRAFVMRGFPATRTATRARASPSTRRRWRTFTSTTSSRRRPATAATSAGSS